MTPAPTPTRLPAAALTDEQIIDLWDEHIPYCDFDVIQFARKLLAANAPVAAPAIPICTKCGGRADVSWCCPDDACPQKQGAPVAQPAGAVPDEGLIERLQHHANDKRNTAFSRSTMNELLALFSSAAPTHSPEPAGAVPKWHQCKYCHLTFRVKDSSGICPSCNTAAPTHVPENSGGALAGDFMLWWKSEEHRQKYSPDHPVFLAAKEAWLAARTCRVDLQGAADKVVITNATGNEDLYLAAVQELIAAVRTLRAAPSPEPATRADGGER